MVMGATANSGLERAIGCASLLAAVLGVGILLYLATRIEKVLGHTGLSIMTKITGILSALAAQITFSALKTS